MIQSRNFLTASRSGSARASIFGAQRRSMHIATADTPNPNSLKFIPEGKTVMGDVSRAAMQ